MQYMRMAVHDVSTTQYDDFGRPRTIPKVLINANEYYLPDTSIENELQRTSDVLRTSEQDSLIDFVNRLKSNKTLWRPVYRPEGNQHRSSGAHLVQDNGDEYWSKKSFGRRTDICVPRYKFFSQL